MLQPGCASSCESAAMSPSLAVSCSTGRLGVRIFMETSSSVFPALGAALCGGARAGPTWILGRPGAKAGGGASGLHAPIGALLPDRGACTEDMDADLVEEGFGYASLDAQADTLALRASAACRKVDDIGNPGSTVEYFLLHVFILPINSCEQPCHMVQSGWYDASHVPDTPVVLGPIGSCRTTTVHTFVQLGEAVSKMYARGEHQLHDQTRPTTQLPHAPYTTPYAWEVHWWAPQSWVISPPFTPIFTLRAGPSHLSARSQRYLRNTFELEGAVWCVLVCSTRLLRLSKRRDPERPAL